MFSPVRKIGCKDGAASLGWHADDEALFQGKFEDVRVLACVSSGVEPEKSQQVKFGDSCYP